MISKEELEKQHIFVIDRIDKLELELKELKEKKERLRFFYDKYFKNKSEVITK